MDYPPEMPPLISLPVSKNLSLLCFRSWLPAGPFFAVREVDYKILRQTANQKKNKSGVFAGPTEQAIRAGIRQTILNHNLNSAAATKGEIAMLKEQGVLGRRAPSCALLAADDMSSLLLTFGKDKLAQELKAAVAKFRKENPPSDHVVYSLAMPKPREPAVPAFSSSSAAASVVAPRQSGKAKGAGSRSERGAGSPADEAPPQQLSARYTKAADLVSKLAAVIQGTSSSSRKRPREQLGLERQPAAAAAMADAAPSGGDRQAGLSALLAAVNGDLPASRRGGAASRNPEDDMPDAAPAPSLLPPAAAASAAAASQQQQQLVPPSAGAGAGAGPSNVQVLPVGTEDKVEQHRAQLRSLRPFNTNGNGSSSSSSSAADDASVDGGPPLKRARLDSAPEGAQQQQGAASASSPAASDSASNSSTSPVPGTAGAGAGAAAAGGWPSPLEALVKAAFPSPTPAAAVLQSASSSSSSSAAAAAAPAASPVENTPGSAASSSSSSSSSSAAPQEQHPALPPAAASVVPMAE